MKLIEIWCVSNSNLNMKILQEIIGESPRLWDTHDKRSYVSCTSNMPSDL